MQWMILRHSQLAPDGAEDVQPLLIFPAHAVFLSGCVVETRMILGAGVIFVAWLRSGQIHSPGAPGRPGTSDSPSRLARVIASIRDTGLDLRLPVSLGWPESVAADQFVVADFPSAAHSAPCTHVDCLAGWCSH